MKSKPFKEYTGVEYDHSRHKYVISPQKVSMLLTGPKSPIRLQSVAQVGREKPSIYYYDDGYYKPTSWSELNRLIKSMMPPELRTSRHVRDVIYELETEPSMNFEEFNCDEDIVNVNNGIYHISTGELTSHTPEILSSIRIPCNYDSNLTLEKNAPVFSQYLDVLTNGDCIEQTFLLEFMGAVFSNIPGYRFKKCLLLVGPGNSGKSQLRELIISILGPQNCQSIDLVKLNERFSTSQLYGKRLGGSGDMAFVRVQEMSTLKNLTGGDDLNSEFKGKDAFSYKYRGFLLFNCNSLPAFGGDRGKHVYERFAIVQCNHVIPEAERDSQLLEKMLREKDAIISVALQHLADAVKRGYKFMESECMMLSREEYAERNNSLVVFVNEGCIKEGRTKRSEFKRIYYKWCQAENMFPERAHDIDAILKEHFNIVPIKASDYYYPLTIKDHIHLSFNH